MRRTVGTAAPYPTALTGRLRARALLPSSQARAPTWATPRGGLMPDLATNVLYYGDNLDILRRHGSA
jgi:hypothetical protein